MKVTDLKMTNELIDLVELIITVDTGTNSFDLIEEIINEKI